MIDYIKGSIAELTPASATIDNQGIGYFINISLNTYSVLNGKKEAKLYIHEAIREDAFQLFGFSEKHERELFAFLISVSGVGAGTARVMLSSMTPRELEAAIASGNTDMLKSVKGIGLKTAQRIIIDLKDKIKQTDALGQIIPVDNQRAEESVAALTMLGFAQAASQKVVYKILKEKPDCRTEEVLKMALKML